MSDTLLIHYNIEYPDQATWSLCNDAGELTSKITTGSLESLTEIAANHRCVVLLHSQCLHINHLQLPTQNKQKMLKAVPYAIEEFIADDIEDFHFVIARNKQDDTTAVVGVKKATLSAVIANFENASIALDKVLPDALCLTADEAGTQWACLYHEQQCYLQTGMFDGLLLPDELLDYTLRNKLDDEQSVHPSKIIFFSEQDDAGVFETLVSTDEIASRDIELIDVTYNDHPLVIFSGHYKQALPLNLLQHEFTQKRQSSGYWQHWRLAAALAVIWLALQLGLTGYQSARLKAENEATRAQIEKIYKRAFPQSKRIVNPRAQMEQKLKELKSGAGNSNGLLSLLTDSFGAMKPDRSDITLQSLTFRNNRMDIGLDGKNLQAIENLNNALNQSKTIKAQIISSSSEKDRVKGNLRIEGRS